MLKSLKDYPKPIRTLAYTTYAIAFVGAIISLLTSNTLFLLLGVIPCFLSALGEIFYQVWFVEKHNQQNTSLNVKYFVFLGITALFFIYPGSLKRFWTNISKKHTKSDHISSE
jgi:hypothetical protein